MKPSPSLQLVADFETTVYKGQDKTEVWAAGVCELWTEDVHILHSIDEFFEYLFSLKKNIELKFHNLKFDGSFILHALYTKLKKRGFKEAYNEFGFQSYKDMPWHSFTYLISSMGQWYQITIKNGRQRIVITDSLKLLPFTLKEIGESFKTKHQKLDMKYEGFRYPGCHISKDEMDYIRNDVLVLKEAMEIMQAQGHKKMTIGSCCLEEYKKTLLKGDWENMFPNQYDYPINPDLYQADNAGSYVRRSYKGGWCYLVPEKANQIFKHGVTFDVNSLYPSMMHSISGNYYPVGNPRFWVGKDIPEILINGNENYCNYYYFITIKTRFYLKEDYLPCIQIKNNQLYKSTEWLKTSDILYNGEYYDTIEEPDGTLTDTAVTLTLTCVDYELIKEHYDLVNCEILHGCYYRTVIGIFDDYINKYAEIKMHSDGAIKATAKLYLNNLYGKFAASTESSYKVAFIKEDGSLGFKIVIENNKKPGYIPVGSAITSYARRFTITAAQKNYHLDGPGFIYADTDSIHCDLPRDQIVDAPEDPVKFCHWKCEAEWTEAIFVRQKTYIEKEGDEYSIKCAGMPDSCKNLFERSMTGKPATEKEIEEEVYTEEQVEFLKHRRTVKDFRKGLRIYGKLMPKQYPGGTLLVPSYYEMR